MPRDFNWQWDRMEEYRLEQAPPLDESEAPEDDDRLWNSLCWSTQGRQGETTERRCPMADLRPRNMSQQEFSDMLREHGFPACSKAAVSLAERSKESGVQFTPEARNVARGLLKSTRRTESRTNPNKTTVWLDDATRIWLEERAYMEDSSVGAVIRGILAEAKKAASDAGTSKAAQGVEVAYPLPSDIITKTEENQV